MFRFGLFIFADHAGSGRSGRASDAAGQGLHRRSQRGTLFRTKFLRGKISFQNNQTEKIAKIIQKSKVEKDEIASNSFNYFQKTAFHTTSAHSYAVLFQIILM